jgi:TetR/AcrR family transcriptional regulator, mexJK operon transcriptional repressor
MRPMEDMKPIAPAVSAITTGRARSRAPIRAVRRGGRPSSSEALQLRGRILQVATELFLVEGYGSTSIEAVAARAGISKRTFYHRFADKAALFTAVVHQIVEQIRPPAEIPLLKGSSLEDILRRLAGIILQAALSPQAMALNRLIVAESMRFPNLARSVYNGPETQEAIDLIAGLLARELPDARLTTDLRRFSAMQFLQMLVVVPQRRAMGADTAMTPRELDAWARNTVSLFLSGCRGLADKTARRKR